MRFLSMVKAAEEQGAPPPALLEAIERLAEETVRSGRGLEMVGLLPSGAGARVRLAKGRITVSDGPFTEAKEVVGGYAVIEAASRDEAIEAARRMLDLHRRHWPGWQGEIEVRQLADGPDA